MKLAEKVNLKQNLKDFFGFDKFRGPQEEIIKNLLDGNDTFVIMPTGAGKSLCYQLPAISMPGVSLVISPLIALMKNQVDQMRSLGIEAGFLNSSMPRMEYERVKNATLDGKLKLLYVAPESLVKEEFIDFLEKSNLSFVAIDEAHCISEWGHDFRPEYRRIREILNKIKKVPLIALTATATPKVQLDIRQNLKMQDAHLYITSFNRENLYYDIRPKVNTIPEIIKFVKSKKDRSGIIYCLSRRKVEEIAEILKVNGIAAVPYHAGLDSSTRTLHQDQFLNEGVQVVVATIAFGMGIDKPDVRFVIHYDVPKSIESYYQETGRGGRDGLEGHCLLFYDHNDIIKLEKFMKDKPLNKRESGKLLLHEMAAFSESGMCRRKFMFHYFGELFDEKRCNEMCDNCKHPREAFDALEHTKIALGCCAEMKNKFGVSHMIDVIRGSKNQKVMLNEHNVLTTYGKGKNLPEKAWKSIFSQLIVNGYLLKDIEEYGVIKLTEEGENYLENPADIQLWTFRDFEALAKKEISQLEEVKEFDEKLFDQLKILRRKIAQEKSVPPFVVFQDPSLEDMAKKFPTSLDEFTNIVGVGKGKAAKFSPAFIKFISKYVEENDIQKAESIVVKTAANRSKNKLFYIQMIDRKTPLDEIARIKQVSFESLLKDIEIIINSGTRLNLDYYIDREIDEDKVDEISDYFMTAETDSLDVAQNELGEEYSKEEIQLVRAKFLSELAN